MINKIEKIQEMRNSLSVGDEIVTIGGIIGKVVKTKDETFVLQVGADKTKIEMARWAVSEITASKAKKSDELEEDDAEEKKAMPKRLKKSDDTEE